VTCVTGEWLADKEARRQIDTRTEVIAAGLLTTFETKYAQSRRNSVPRSALTGTVTVTEV
jgi:hypothetical protein